MIESPIFDIGDEDFANSKLLASEVDAHKFIIEMGTATLKFPIAKNMTKPTSTTLLL